MQTQEILQGKEQAGNAKGRKTSFEFHDVIDAIKGGKRKSEDLALFEKAAVRLAPEQIQPMADYLVEQEGCSQEFAQRFMQDAAFRRRVISLGGNFNQNGEQMLHLDEAEIFTALMEPKSDDITPILKATNLGRSFAKTEALGAADVRAVRLNEIRYALANTPPGEAHAMMEQILKSAFADAGMQEQNWDELFGSSDKLEMFLNNKELKQMYEEEMGRKIDFLHRRVELRWNDHEGSTRTPVMSVTQMARNPQTGEISRLGLDIELEKRVNSQTGKIEDRRVAKEIVIVLDRDVRNNQQGLRFLLDKLNLIREYKLDEIEFKANIRIGSYVWARIADMDVSSMAKQYLESEDVDGIGPEPWDAKKSASLKARIFEKHVLPAYTKNFEEALACMPPSLREQHEVSLRSELQVLMEKAKTGMLTMEELANLGQSSNIVGFTDQGLIVGAEDPSAQQKGHIGKAAIMGIPWLARISLDRRSLSHLIDKMNKGKPVSSLLMKAGLMFVN